MPRSGTPSFSPLAIPVALAPLALLLACQPPATGRATPRPAPGAAPTRPRGEVPPTWGLAPGRDRLNLVGNGDTLSGIARRFRVAGGQEALARLNGLVAPFLLRPGRMIRIPDAAGPAHGLLRYPEIRRTPPAPLPCGVSFATPVASPAAGCRRRYCAEGPPAAGRVCQCFRDRHRFELAYEVGPTTFPLRTGDWGSTTDATGFEATLADLDDDGQPELVLSHHQSTSNGIGVRWYRVEVFAPGRRAGALARWESHGGQGIVSREPGETRCAVIVVNLEHLPAEWRGTGVFWVGRAYRMAGGRLVPHPTAPVRRVRVDHSGMPDERPRPTGLFPTSAWGLGEAFAAPRTDGLDGEWLPSTARVLSWVRARVVSVGWSPLRFRLRLASGGALDVSAEGEDEHALGHWGDRATGRLLPLEYRSDAERAALIGAEVELVTYAGDWNDRVRILWR